MDLEQNRCSSQAAWKPCSPVRYTWQLKRVPDYKPGVDIASDIAVRILQHFRIPILAARVTVYQKWPSKPTWRSSAWPAVSEKELREACHLPETAFLMWPGRRRSPQQGPWEVSQGSLPLGVSCLVSLCQQSHLTLELPAACTLLAELTLVLDQTFKLIFSLWTIHFRTENGWFWKVSETGIAVFVASLGACIEKEDTVLWLFTQPTMVSGLWDAFL